MGLTIPHVFTWLVALLLPEADYYVSLLSYSKYCPTCTATGPYCCVTFTSYCMYGTHIYNTCTTYVIYTVRTVSVSLSDTSTKYAYESRSLSKSIASVRVGAA